MWFQKSKKILVLFILFSLLLPALAAAQENHNCDFAAVLAKTNHLLADVMSRPAPFEFYYHFVRSRSTAGTNPDGYGITYSKDGEITIPWSPDLPVPGLQVWYCEDHYNDNPVPMDQAHLAINNPANEAVMVMSHARNGSGGESGGNHPFFIDWNHRTYVFMHNGLIWDSDEDPANIKEALWHELYNLHGTGNGQWFRQHPSNWVPANLVDDCDQFIDSELLFHWIMKNIIDAHGSIHAGLHYALTAVVHHPDDYTIDLDQVFRIDPDEPNPWGLNKINIVLSDSDSLYVFRNTPTTWDDDGWYRLSYQGYNDYYAVKTQDNLAEPLDQYMLVQLTRHAQPRVLHNFMDGGFSDFRILVKDDPDPVETGEQLVYKVLVINCGPEPAHNVFLSNTIDDDLVNPFITYDWTFSMPWQSLIDVGSFHALESKGLYVAGDVLGTGLPHALEYKVTLHSFQANFDPNPDNHTCYEKTEVIMPQGTALSLDR